MTSRLHPYIVRFREAMDSFYPNLWEHLDLVPTLPLETASQVLHFLLSYCYNQNVMNIMLGRDTIVALPREWVLANIEREADFIYKYPDENDDWEYRRLGEIYLELGDYGILERHIQRGKTIDNPHIQEAAHDFEYMMMKKRHTLVTTDWLYEHLHDANLRIVDIRGHVRPASEPLPHYFNHREDYEKSHIPGAVFVDWVNEITDPADPRHAKIAPPLLFAEVMCRYGIGPNTFVVVYDDAGSMFAARLYWALNYYGHENVAVLDGGWQKWVAENRPTTADLPTYPPTYFVATPHPEWIRTLDQVQSTLHNPATVLVDVRTPEEYGGQFARAPRKGHIPGAVNLPKAKFNEADGTLQPAPVLQNLIQLAGVEGQEAVFYCNGGVSASLGFLAARIAGLDNIAIYDGSWKEWGNQEDTPIE